MVGKTYRAPAAATCSSRIHRVLNPILNSWALVMTLKLSVISGAVSVYAKPTSIGPPKFATPKTVIAGPSPVGLKLLFDWLRVANCYGNSYNRRMERYE